jgi:hypothetical protein
MNRSSSLARRTPLRATKTLRRSRFMRSHRKSKYARRPRDFVFMSWVRTRPCVVSVLAPFLFLSTPEQAAKFKATPCSGHVEADHAGDRGIGQKADDSTCIPMCSSHHAQRHAHSGIFFQFTQLELRAWRTEAITRTQTAWNNK